MSLPGRVAAAVAIVAVGGDAEAKRRSGSVVILPAVPEGKVDADLVDAIDESLEAIAGTYHAVALIAGDALSAKLGVSVRDATRNCDDNIRCLTRLAKRVGASRLIVGRATSRAEVTHMRLLCIEVGSRHILRTALVSLALGEEVEPRLRDGIDSILGVEVESGIAPSPDELADAPELVMPALVPMPRLEPDGGGEGATQGGNTVAAAPVGRAATAPPPTGDGVPLLRYGSIGMLGLSAVMFGLSGYYGLEYRRATGEIDKHGELTTSLREAVRLETKANDARSRAGWLLVAGGISTLAAGALFLVDLQVRSSSGVDVALGVNGTHVRIVAVW